jgi:hypothetical protein
MEEGKKKEEGRRKEEGGRRKEEGGRKEEGERRGGRRGGRKEEGGRRKEEGGRRKEEGGGNGIILLPSSSPPHKATRNVRVQFALRVSGTLYAVRNNLFPVFKFKCISFK